MHDPILTKRGRRPALAGWLLAALLCSAPAAQAAEQAKVVLTWPNGKPQVVQFWDNGVHLRDEHRDQDGHKRQEARYDGAVVRWQQFRDDGSVQAQWQTAAGRREGEEQWLDPQGRLVRSVPWRNGKRHGLIREFDAQGHLQSEVPYADDAAVGPQVGYYPTGERRSVSPLLDGVRHGVEIIYDREGWKYAEMPYWHGVLDGKVQFFGKEGWRRGEIVYHKGQAQSPEVQYHRNGQRAMVVPLRPDGQRQGLAERFDEAGIRLAEQPYVAGKEHGWDRRWDSFGRLLAEVEWREGEPCCGERGFWPSGALRSERVYVNLAQDGTETDYFDRDAEAGTDHRVELRVALVQGKKAGRAQVYDRQGRRWSELDFVDDRREGPEVRYYPSGQKQGEFQWRSDRLTGLASTYWPSGRLQSRYPADDGAGTGLEQRWDEDGILRMDVPLVQGKKHGVARLYDQRGKLRATQTWREDVLDGPEVRYHKGKPLGTWQWHNGELVSGPKPSDVAAAEEGPDEAANKPKGGAAPGASDSTSEARKVRRAAHKVRRERDDNSDVARSYWPGGELRSALPKRGKGTEVQFHDNGEVAVVAAVDQGVRQGLARTFDRSGRLTSQVNYVDGTRDGEEVEFGPDGEKVGSRHWQRGRPVGVNRTWFPGGGLQSERHADPNLPSGTEVQYFRSGGVRLFVPLKFGKRDGIATLYSESGVKSAEVTWREGRKHGEERRYDARGGLIERLWWQADQAVPAPGPGESRPSTKEPR